MAILGKLMENRIKETVRDKEKAELDREDYYQNLIDELADSNNNLRNKITELEDKVLTMQQYKDESFLDEVALDNAEEINDIFVRSWQGVGQRTAVVQNLLRSMLNRGLTGSADGK